MRCQKRSMPFGKINAIHSMVDGSWGISSDPSPRHLRRPPHQDLLDHRTIRTETSAGTSSDVSTTIPYARPYGRPGYSHGERNASENLSGTLSSKAHKNEQYGKVSKHHLPRKDRIRTNLERHFRAGVGGTRLLTRMRRKACRLP